MSEKKTGRRVQIYIPADLVKKWDSLPRYERSAEVAKALRKLWGFAGIAHDIAHDDDLSNKKAASDEADTAL